MKLNELTGFCHRLGIGLRAGVDIVRMLESEQRIGKSKHRQAISAVKQRVRLGDSLADAMQQQADHFPLLLIQMIKAGEASGRLEYVFQYMAEYYEQLRRTRSSFWQRISWPLIQLALAIGIIGLVILLQGMLSPNSGYDASSLGLRGVRGFIIYCSVLAAVFGTLSLLAFAAWNNWFKCHQVIVPALQRVPQLGTALMTLGLSRLSLTLSMLLNAGSDATQAVKQAFIATGNHYLIGGMRPAVEEVARGASFGDAFEKSAVLPRDFVDAVRIGELSGTETESLDHLAQQYQQRSVQALNSIATIASVTIWLAITCLIGFMVIRMAMQYINLLNSTLQNPMG
jgi:type IV pilus assembly protein PilC